jgi:hypothetical protein
MIEIGQYKIVPPSFSMDGLMQDNILLKQRNSNLAAFAVVGLVASSILLGYYLKAKQDAEKYKVRLAQL